MRTETTTETLTEAEMAAMRTLEDNARRAFRNAKIRGTTGMSIPNARQIVGTNGLTCSQAVYQKVFEPAARVAAQIVGIELWD